MEETKAGSVPELIGIDHDDHHAEHVVTTADGRQLVLTMPFVPAGTVVNKYGSSMPPAGETQRWRGLLRSV